MDYHFLYKTVNQVTNKYYIGVHSTNQLDDGYLGSGVVIKRSIAKYGASSHTREYIGFFDTRVECLEAEKLYITKALLEDAMCMNLRQGGRGGFVRFTAEQYHANSEKSQASQAKLRATDPDWQARISKRVSEANKQHYANGTRSINVKPHVPGEYKHTDEVKQRISSTTKGLCAGEKNSQFGTMWITDGVNNIKQAKDTPLPEGWRHGRVMKK